MERLKLEFYYGQEAEQFTFYRLPKALITDDRFKDISNNSKLLYGLMLDRMSLSVVGQRIEGDANDKLFFRPLKNRPRSLGANGRLTAIIRHIIGEY